MQNQRSLRPGNVLALWVEFLLTARFELDAGSYLYFERGILGAMHDAGRRAAGAWLAAGPRVDHLDEPATADRALRVE